MKMISNAFTILCVFLCQAGVNAQYQPSFSAVEDLQEEYYTTVTTITYQILPQDDVDAQTITDSKKDEAVIAGIFAARPKIRRYVINELMVGKSADEKTPWIPDNYQPQQNGKPFTDLCFGMVKDENTVLGNYLANFFASQQKPLITIGMILTKDMKGMITTYDNHFSKDAFKALRKAQESPYENMLRVWVGQNREELEKDELNQDYVKQDAKYLTDEQNNGGWHEDRDMLEMILMKKSVKYARAVMQEFECNNNGKLIENIIIENSHNSGLDANLADAYASIALYLKDKYTYIVHIMRKYSDGNDLWAVWILCIAVLHPDEWAKVEAAFKKYDAEDYLSKFIIQKNTSDSIMAELMAAIVNPAFKPKTFKIKPVPGFPPGQYGTPPPVPPTTVPPGTPGTPSTVPPTTVPPGTPGTPSTVPPTTVPPGTPGTPPPVPPTTVPPGTPGTPPPVPPTTVPPGTPGTPSTVPPTTVPPGTPGTPPPVPPTTVAS